MLQNQEILLKEEASLEEMRVVVLLVDDQAMVGEAVRRSLLSEPNLEFHFCANPDEAIAAALRIRPTVILQDLVMHGVDGLTLVQRYRNTPQLRETPIIVLSTKEDPKVKREAFQNGANDYLVKLPDSIELIARVRYHTRSYMTLVQRNEAYRQLRQSQVKLQEANLELQRLTNLDGLTSLANRRYFDEYISSEWRRSIRDNTALSLLMIDVDNFKLYNDNYGHVLGDTVLRQIASIIQGHARRPGDLAARIGGEEFSVILPTTPLRNVQALGESLVKCVFAQNIEHVASSNGTRVTLSVGCASVIPTADASHTVLIEAADSALYHAKHSGRNRVEVSITSTAPMHLRQQSGAA